MTLIITAIHAHFGIWQSSDHDVSLGTRVVDRDWSKQVAIYCRNGAMLLGYTGIAQSPDGRSLAEWISDIAAVAGRADPACTQLAPTWLTVEETWTMLRDGATATFSRGPREYRKSKLIIAGGAFSEGKVYLSGVTNVRKSGQLRDDFIFMSKEITTPVVMANGSGAEYVKADGQRVASIIAKRPKKMTDYLGLLARANERAARSHGDGVSEWCQTALLPRSGFPLHAETFHPLKVRSSRLFRPLRFVHAGWDWTPILDTQYRRAAATLRKAAMNSSWVIHHRPL